MSLGAEWERTFRDGIGGQYEFTASTRGDGYWVNDLSPLSNPDLPSAYFPFNGAPAAEPINPNFLDGRVFPQVGLKWSYPLIHPADADPADRADRRGLCGTQRRQPAQNPQRGQPVLRL